MFKSFALSLLLALAFSLSGCASNGFNPITGQSTQPGTYAYQIAPDGTITVNASTLRGGPDLHVDSDGSVSVTPSRDAVIKELGELLLAP